MGTFESAITEIEDDELHVGDVARADHWIGFR